MYKYHAKEPKAVNGCHNFVEKNTVRHPQVSFEVEIMLHHKNIYRAVAVTAGNYSEGIDFKSRWTNGLPLLSFAKKIANDIPISEFSKTQDWPYFEEKTSSLFEDIKNEISSLDEDISIQELSTSTFIEIIIDNFEYFGNQSYTYRALMALMKMMAEVFPEPSEESLLADYVSLLDTLSKEWES